MMKSFSAFTRLKNVISRLFANSENFPLLSDHVVSYLSYTLLSAYIPSIPLHLPPSAPRIPFHLPKRPRISQYDEKVQFLNN